MIPLQEEGNSGVIHDLFQLRHALGSGGRCHVLEEWQAGGVDVHTQKLGAVLLGLVDFPEHQVPAPGA